MFPNFISIFFKSSSEVKTGIIIVYGLSGVNYKSISFITSEI